MTAKNKPAGLMAYRLDLLESAVRDISSSLKSIESTLAKHADTKNALDRVFGEVKAVGERVTKLEHAMPVLTLTSNWVRTGVVGIVTLVLAAAWKLLVVP